ncbi:tryptophan 2,3-dioxygenase [Kitasatospora sp. NPDC051984]|uniref:tryptophan 2,3-dioxygenase n=1 Tax=Kitasatospora sp. NPDC051984 TaxID=3364059 RepID=UPI0037C800AA
MTGQTHRPHLRYGNDQEPGTSTPYSRYVRLTELHSLQQPRSTEPSEYTFIVTTQVMELLFGQLHREWTAARAALREDDLSAAGDALRRGHHVQDVLVSSWDLLATMTPAEFNAFRPLLGEASGFQSSAYLLLEFLLGNKSERLLTMYQDSPGEYDALFAELRTPSLYDEALAVLARRGLEIPPAPSTAHHGHDDTVEAAWRTVYTDPALADLARLGEALLDTAERVTRWRQRHYSTVKRTMGGKPGTAGSSGLSWLKHAADQDVFPELWSVRNEL